jgi:hypothetical protein
MLFIFPYIDSSILLKVLHTHVHEKSFESSNETKNIKEQSNKWLDVETWI